HPKTGSLVRGVVSGIGGYGNCMGIPTVGGEVYFDECYNGNNLVNAMCVGLIKKKNIFYAKAGGIGNPVIYVGAKTGRDGIHGATMASDVFDEKSEERRPTVQVGDPFTEKKLMEACVELMESDRGRQMLYGIQDMGAAGLTCSSVEMSGKGRVGMNLQLDQVPLRETGMTPYEIMLSESQERMFLVARKGHEEEIINLFKKWDLDAVQVGEITKGHEVVIRSNGSVAGIVPNLPISEEAPVCRRPVRRPKQTQAVGRPAATRLSNEENRQPAAEILKKLLSSPNIASKRWIYRQYDHTVGTDTVVLPGSDAAVIQIKGTKKALALTTDCNSRYCSLDPREGAKIAVAEAARNIVCSGGRPLAVTDCLNFGSPENPEVMWQFKQATEGLSEACRAFGTPIVSGNVSFYNESQQGSIYPTPTIGMVGLLDDVNHHCTQWFKEGGDLIVLVGPPLTKGGWGDFGGSEYLKVTHGLISGRPPRLNSPLEKRVQATVLAAIRKGWIRSAHDGSEGGLAVALAECCVTGDQILGVNIDYVGAGFPRPGAVTAPLQKISTLFAETQSRIIVSLKEDHLQKFLKLAKLKKVPATVLGKVGGDRFKIGESVDLSVREVQNAWSEGFEKGVFRK
ncbi:MAG: phosphoribosylformylglycinamidine synthase subunit PurL, partial [Deltaproteobacteria bacterium]|nr:phosphoribosylformylglycinamidine synthase subunit PurL [Deltaproteobacteria bacterium]